MDLILNARNFIDNLAQGSRRVTGPGPSSELLRTYKHTQLHVVDCTSLQSVAAELLAAQGLSAFHKLYVGFISCSCGAVDRRLF